MVHLRGMVHEGWYMVQEAKLWYVYIIMVRSGNAGAIPPRQCVVPQVHENDGQIEPFKFRIASSPTIFSRYCPHSVGTILKTSERRLRRYKGV